MIIASKWLTAYLSRQTEFWVIEKEQRCSWEKREISLPPPHPALLPGAFLHVALQPEGGRAPNTVPTGTPLKMPSPRQVPTALVRDVPRDPCGSPQDFSSVSVREGSRTHEHAHRPAL